MVTSLSSTPLFAGRKRQQAEPSGSDESRRRLRSSRLEPSSIEVLGSSDSYTSSPRAESPDELARKPHTEMTLEELESCAAKVPELGDVFQSRAGGNLRKQANLLSEKELWRGLERHSAMQTYTSLGLIQEVDYPLHPDKKYTKKSEKLNPLANDRYKALFDLHSLVQNPSYRISPHSKKYLKAVGIINRDNVIDQATLYDVKRILHMDPDTQEFSLIRPSQSEANTYFRLSGKS